MNRRHALDGAVGAQAWSSTVGVFISSSMPGTSCAGRSSAAANRTLWRIVLVRMRTDERTRAYVTRRLAEGKTKREIMRRLKRYVAREIFKALSRPTAASP
jgi:hypothetical protein